jgi:hypothetical protein
MAGRINVESGDVQVVALFMRLATYTLAIAGAWRGTAAILHAS